MLFLESKTWNLKNKICKKYWKIFLKCLLIFLWFFFGFFVIYLVIFSRNLNVINSFQAWFE